MSVYDVPCTECREDARQKPLSVDGILELMKGMPTVTTPTFLPAPQPLVISFTVGADGEVEGNPFTGIELVENKLLTVPKEVPVRVHRKKRIQKKWLNKYGTKTVDAPSPEVYMIDGRVAGHPETIRKLWAKKWRS